MSARAWVEGEWLAASATRAVITALEAADAQPRFVGGCVRNALMGRAVADIDIATPAPPERVIAALEAAGLKAVPTGLAHGTVTALAEARPFEITTLRRDVATDGRHATVAFTDDWEQDARRRDFTMNALYAEPDGRVVDPTGEGLADLRAARVRFIGEASARIAEDYLRALRFFRIHAWYGAGELDADGLAACARAAGGLARLSAERLGAETVKLLAAPDPACALAAMAQAGVLAAYAPELRPQPEAFTRLIAIEAEEGVAPDWRRRMAFLLEAPGAAEAVAKRLRLSKAQGKRLAQTLAPPPPEPAPPSARAAVYGRGREAALDALLIAWAGDDGAPTPWRDALAAIRAFAPPEFPLRGADALAAGLAGPEVGAALSAAEAAWIASDFTASRDQLARAFLTPTPSSR